MQYAILFHEPPKEFAKRTDPEASEAYWTGWRAYIEAARASGLMTDGQGLSPPDTATTVTIRDGQRQVQDGPFAATREELGGFIMLDAPDLDTALAWAAKAPCAATGRVEVRPVMPSEEA